MVTCLVKFQYTIILYYGDLIIRVFRIALGISVSQLGFLLLSKHFSKTVEIYHGSKIRKLYEEVESTCI